MVGGDVWDIFRFSAGEMTFVVRGRDTEHNQFLAINVVDSGEDVQIMDSIWWQDRTALWSPKLKPGADNHIARIGYSYDAMEAWLKAVELCIHGICPVCGCKDTMHSGTGGLWCPDCGASFGALERVQANDVLKQVRDLLA